MKTRKKYSKCKAIVRKLSNRYKRLSSDSKEHFHEDPCVQRSMESLEKEMPRWLSNLVQHYSYLQMAHNESCFKGFNRDFYGGLLCSLKTDDSPNPILFHAGGNGYKEIFMTKISIKKKTNLHSGKKCSRVVVDEPVYQVSSSKKGVIAIRHKKKSSILTLNLDEQSLQIGESISIDSDHLSDVRPSPFLANEVVISTKSGVVSLWDVNKSMCNQIIKKGNSPSSQGWACSYFAGHPRQIVTADNTSVKMFDHRDSFQSGCDMFTLSPMLVKKNDLIMSAIPLDFPYHAVSTESTVFMMDQRFPCSPVLQWHLERFSYPQFLEFIKLPSSTGSLSSEAVIFAATQQPAKIVCIPFSLSHGQPPRSRILPWQVGNNRDIFEQELQLGGVEWCHLEKKFVTSMAGMTVVNESTSNFNAFTVFQMDSFGDLFYQQFPFDENVDQAAGGYCQLKEPEPNVWRAAVDRVRKCLSKFNIQSREYVVDFGGQQSDIDEPEDTDEQLRFDDISEMFNPLKEEEEMLQSQSPQPCLPVANAEVKSWESFTHRGINTKLLIALKEGKEISHLLEQRENEHQKKKRTLHENLLKSEHGKRRRSRRQSEREPSPESQEEDDHSEH